MKKLVSLLIVAAMLVTGLVAVVPGTAADLPESELYTHITGEISSDKTTLTVSVTLGNNPGLWLYRARLSYNSAALKLVKTENKDVWPDSKVVSPGRVDANPVTFYAEMGTEIKNNTNNGLVYVYTFEILNESESFNINMAINPNEVFGVVEGTGDRVPHEMTIINDCPQELPFDTSALDALAADIMELPAYDGMSDEQIAKTLALYDSVHALSGKAETYFAETYADAITKIDELYAAHQWAIVAKELDALGARAEALPAYAQMTAEQVQEMLALRTEIAALEETHKAYVQEKFADALARLDASYAEYERVEGLNAIGARINALPAYAQMSEAQIQEMLALVSELAALPADDLTYIKNTFAEGYGRLEASNAAYAHAQELNAIGARIEALPDYAQMTAEQVQEMCTLVAAVEAMPAEDSAYISNNFSDAYNRMNASYARYTRVQELDALAARINALPNDYYAMTEADVAEMLALVETIDAIEAVEDQQYMMDNYADALQKLVEVYTTYEMEQGIKELIARIEALPDAEVITEEYLDEVTELRMIVSAGVLAARLQQEIPEAYENLVNAYFKLTYGGTDAVDMEKANAFVDAVKALTDGQDQEVLDLLYSLAVMEEDDAITADYIMLTYPEAFETLLEKYVEILSEAEVDVERLAALEEEILALPAYEEMTAEDKAALEDIIATVSGLSPVEMFTFKTVFVEGYEAYVALYEAYTADNKGSDEPPVTTPSDTTAAPSADDTTASGSGDSKKPVQTGDNMAYIVVATVVAAAACAVVVVVRKKKETV